MSDTKEEEDFTCSQPTPSLTFALCKISVLQMCKAHRTPPSACIAHSKSTLKGGY